MFVALFKHDAINKKLVKLYHYIVFSLTR